jgi:hypothetical protein
VSDGFGGTSTATVSITVFAVNDAPVVVAADAAGGVTEDADDPTLSDSGNIVFDDVDGADTYTRSRVHGRGEHTGWLAGGRHHDTGHG